MANATKDVLIIPKVDSDSSDNMLPLKVTKELHAQVKSISQESGLSISTVACMIVKFGLDRVKIVEGEE